MMKELAFCIVFTAIFTGLKAQECNSAKLDECNVILQKSQNAGSDQAEMCRILNEFESCIEPCKTLDKDDPLYERFNGMYAPMANVIPSCKCMGISTCLMALKEVAPETMCKKYEEAKTCMEPHLEKCRNEPAYTSVEGTLKNFESQCSSGCNIPELYICFKSLEQVTQDISNILNYREGFCMKMSEFKTCSGAKLEMCRKANNDDAKFAVKQGDMINNLMELLCMKEAKSLNESTECFEKKKVSESMEKCLNSSTPEKDDMGKFVEETESQQCKRIQEHNECAESAVMMNCDKETASVAVRLGEAILKIIYNNKGLACPTGGAGNLVPMTWIFMAASLLALFLM